MSYFTECEPSKCSTDRETVPELHALVQRAATLASVTIVLEFNRFLHPNKYIYVSPHKPDLEMDHSVLGSDMTLNISNTNRMSIF